MPTLPNMALVTPVQGADRGTWDDKINAAFALVDAHDHTSGKGVAIASAALNIDGNVAWGGNAITGLGLITFTPIAPLVSGSKDLFVSSADNELYWRTNSGTNVKLTNGASINTTLVGGIVGDYASVGAELAYDDANKTYTFKDQSTPTKKWARLGSGPVRIHEFDTTESTYVEFAVDAALAASYTVTWPAALPASTVLMQIAADGTLVCSNTLATDADITLVGMADYNHGAKKVAQLCGPGFAATGSYSSGTIPGPPDILYHRLALTTTVYVPLDKMGLRDGDRITLIEIDGDAHGGSEPTVYIETQQHGPNVGAHTYTPQGGDTIGSTGVLRCLLDTPVVLGAVGAAGEYLMLKLTAGSADTDFYTVRVTYDHP